MNTQDEHDSALTPAQRMIVEQPWDTRTLVTAGAGAGKTTTLTYRLEHLTAVEELAASEILVLSFSRGAVRELRDRVDQLATTARRVRAQTFDGWAMALLRQQNPNQTDYTGTSFDDRIVLAIEAIKMGVLESFEAGPPAHVVIDEVQDLVGVRRQMVETLLARLSKSCGFTVVGDAAQSIYGFQVSDPEERAAESNRFFDWIKAEYPDDLVELALRDNFRARTPEARLALSVGDRLQRLSADSKVADVEARAIHDELRALLKGVPDFGDLDDQFTQESLRLSGGTTAILCRDNGQVLQLSETLSNYDVPHSIQRSPRTRAAPTWVAELLLSTSGAELTEECFLEFMSKTPTEIDEPERTWRSLRRVAASRGNKLDLEQLRRAVAEGRLPDELTPAGPQPLILSTVHRAKGLEFDRVILVDSRATAFPDGRKTDLPAEARLLYVAMTRQRDDLYRLAIAKNWKMRKSKHPDRWYIGGGKRWVRCGIEVGAEDVSVELPPGVRDLVSDPIELQRYLGQAVKAGDEVTLLRLHELQVSANESPPYAIFHSGQPVGVVSERFRRDLWQLLKVNRSFVPQNWPREITGTRIDVLESVAGSTAVTERSGLGQRGVWIAPRLCGMGRFIWDSKITEEGGVAV